MPFFANLGPRMAAAWRVGPRRTLVKACLKTGVLNVPWLHRWDILHDESAQNPERMRIFLERYEALAATVPGWQPLRFTGLRVLEVGCGPLGGWGPLALACGAASYVGCDPALDSGLFGTEAFLDGYLADVVNDMVANMPNDAGWAGDNATFVKAFRERCVYMAATVETLDPDARFDIVLSNSCLEHITPFAPFAAALAARLAPGARMLHLVDFSNHRSKEHPFRPLYDMAPDQYLRRFGPHINLLRPPDMVDAFAAHGIAARCVPLEVRDDLIDPARIHPAWRERYDAATLAVRAAVIVSGIVSGRTPPLVTSS